MSYHLDVTGTAATEELWMGNDWYAFMGKRPTHKIKDEVARLVHQFEAHVPDELVATFFRNRVGVKAVEEREDGKIRILFYDREWMKRKVDTLKLLRAFEKEVDEYLPEKGVRLYKA